MIQTSFADDPINLVVVDGETLAVEATSDLVGTPFASFRIWITFFLSETLSPGSLGQPFVFSSRPFHPLV
jgi:hypothetical protein